MLKYLLCNIKSSPVTLHSVLERMNTQEEIITRVEELLELPVEETMREANELKSAFYALNHQKLEQQKLEHRELGAHMDDFIAIANPLEETFKELFSKYRDNKAKFVHQKEVEQKKNLTEKQEVLTGLKELIDNEENIGKSFDRFKDFQDRWKKVGAVLSDKVADLNAAYKAEIDRFYYNITINKELKEYDLAKNFEIREEIVKKLVGLESAEKIKDIEFILAAAKEEWDEAGPVKPEVYQGLRVDWSSALSRSSVITFNSRVMAGAAPPPIVDWPSPFRTAVSMKKSSTAACFGPMPDWPRHFVVSAVYTAPHGTILPFQSRIPAAAGGSAIAHPGSKRPV